MNSIDLQWNDDQVNHGWTLQSTSSMMVLQIEMNLSKCHHFLLNMIFRSLFFPILLITLCINFAIVISRDIRYFSGILTGILSGFLIYVFLEPLFFPVGLNLAVVALWVLSIMSAFVGMSLGVMLPTLFPGLCLGVNLALLSGCFVSSQYVLYFPVAGGVLALAGAYVSVRYVILLLFEI